MVLAVQLARQAVYENRLDSLPALTDVLMYTGSTVAGAVGGPALAGPPGF